MCPKVQESPALGNVWMLSISSRDLDSETSVPVAPAQVRTLFTYRVVKQIVSSRQLVRWLMVIVVRIYGVEGRLARSKGQRTLREGEGLSERLAVSFL